MFVGGICVLFVCVCLCVCCVLVSGACPSRLTSNNNNPNPHTAYGTPSAQALVLWVTRGVYPGGAFGSVAGLDAMCNSIQPVGVIGSFAHQSQARVALISNSTTSASDPQRFPQNIDIVNTKGECLGRNAQDIYNSDLTYLILDETGAPLSDNPTVSTFVWTGTGVVGGNSNVGGDRGGDPQDDPAQYCNDWSSNSSSVVSHQSGQLPWAQGGSATQWFTGENDDTCEQLHHFYCISAVPAPTAAPTTAAPTSSNSGGQGDPQFVGLQGQSFQVHGVPDEYFNLLSHPFTQLNSHLTYLATGTCNYNDTLCWSHPGTYVDELGVMLPGVHLSVKAGPHSQGLIVTVNGKQMHMPKHLHTQSRTRQAGAGTSYTVTFPIQLDNDTITMSHNAWLDPPDNHMTNPSASPWWSWLHDASCRVSFHSQNQVIINTPVATIDIHNAEQFFNFQLEFHAPRLLLAGAPVHHVLQSDSSVHSVQTESSQQSPHPQFPMHGLIGQTWKNVRYPHGRLYAGQVDDYMLTDRQLFSTQFHFNEYLY